MLGQGPAGLQRRPAPSPEAPEALDDERRHVGAASAAASAMQSPACAPFESDMFSSPETLRAYPGMRALRCQAPVQVAQGIAEVGFG